MSFRSIPNQPIIFNSQQDIESQCGCPPGDYIQLVDQATDDIFFQIEADVCTTLLGSTQNVLVWTITDGQVFSNASGGGPFNFLLSFNDAIEFKIYKISIRIPTLTQGELTVTINGGDSMTFYLPGTYVFYLNTTVNNPTLVFTGLTFIGVFDFPEVYGVGSDLIVGWVNQDFIPIELASVASKTLNGNKITFHLPAQDQDVAGCNRLAITEQCVNDCGQLGIIGGDFNDSNNWPLNDCDWVIGSGQAVWTYDTDSTCAIYNVTELCEGKEYRIVTEITAVNECALTFFAGTGGSITPAFANTIGVHEFILIAGSGVNMKFAMRATSTSILTSSVNVNYVTVQATGGSVTYNQYSNIINLGEFNDPCLYLKLSACNTNDQFNFAFGTSGFAPQIRVEGLKSKPQYESQAERFRYASGRFSIPFSNRLKRWSFHFGRLPEFMLDFLSIAFFFDNCYVNGTKYVPAENDFPDVDWSDADIKLGRLDIDLYEKQDKVLKVLCAAETADCMPGDEPILPFKEFQDDYGINFNDGIGYDFQDQ